MLQYAGVVISGAAVLISLILILALVLRTRKTRDRLLLAFAKVRKELLSFTIRGAVIMLVIVAVLYVAVSYWINQNTAVFYLFGAACAGVIAFAALEIVSLCGALAAEDEEKGFRASAAHVVTGSLAIGLLAAGLPVLLFYCLFFLFQINTATEDMCGYALGACVVALFFRTRSNLYTRLLDWVGSLICAGTAAVMLSGISLLEAGVGGLFKQRTAFLLPLLLLAVGTAVFFVVSPLIRAKDARALAGRFHIVSILASLVTCGVGVYLCYRFLHNIDYCVPVVAGMVAAAMAAESAAVRKAGIARYVRQLEKNEETALYVIHDPLIRDVRSGLISTMLPMIFLCCACYASYYFAGFYGLALAAVSAAACSNVQMMSVFLSPIYRMAFEIREAGGMKSEESFAQLKAGDGELIGRENGVSIISAALSAIALYGVFTRFAEFETADLADPIVLLALVIGVMLPCFYMAGAMGEPLNAVVHVKRRAIPGIVGFASVMLIGCLFSAEALTGEVTGVICASTMLSLLFSNSGAVLRIKSESALNTLMKLTVSAAVTFLPLFTTSILS